MSIKIAITCFFLLVVASTACLNSTQVEGKCTNCSSLEVLVNGSCYQKIRGCLRHAAGPICIECQNGYVLNKAICIREAQFNNNTNLSFIPPVVIGPIVALTLEDIRNRLGEQYGAYASEANDYFTTKYGEVAKAKIRNVDRLETKKGTFLVIEYQGTNSIKYQAVSYVNNSGFIREWSFGPQATFKNDPVTANTLIRAAMGDKLKDNIIFQMKQEGEIYIFDYMNAKFDITRVVVSKADLNAGAGLLAKLRIKNMLLSELAQEAIVDAYPYLQNSKPVTVQKYDDYFVIAYSATLSISYKFSNFNFLINNPLTIPTNVFNTGEPDALGAFSNFTAYSDTRLAAVIDYIVRQFPQIIGSMISRVQSQSVSGINFILSLKKQLTNVTFDQYEFKIGIAFDKTVVMFQGKKNNKVIYSNNYNYNIDPIFFSNYKLVEAETQINNIPPIKSVEFKQTGNKKYFKVVYFPTQFSEFEYLTDINKLNVLSYYVEGENILATLSAAKQLATRRSNDILLKFLQDANPLAQQSRIKEVIYNIPSYTVIVATPTGTYSATILDKGQLSLEQFTKISEVTCFTMTVTQVQENDSIAAIDSYLKNNYPLADYSLQLVQISVKTGKVGYRLIYSNLKLKQIEIYLEEANNTASVIKASYLNFGYSLVETDATNTQYQKIITYLKTTTLAGEKVPFFTESNSSVVKGYYDDGKTITEIYYDKLTDKVTTQAIYTRPYLLLPDGFALETLILPGGAGLTSSENATIVKLSAEAVKKYTIVLKDANITFVDKKNSTYYLLMYKGSYGYLKIEATIDSTGKITVGRLIITGYVEGDLSACTQFSAQGRCLSCDKDNEIEFQGSCFKKMEGCVIQAANICVKCNVDYVKSASKCVKECSAFFK